MGLLDKIRGGEKDKDVTTIEAPCLHTALVPRCVARCGERATVVRQVLAVAARDGQDRLAFDQPIKADILSPEIRREAPA
jgi:hypothetical protein